MTLLKAAKQVKLKPQPKKSKIDKQILELAFAYVDDKISFSQIKRAHGSGMYARMAVAYMQNAKELK